MEHLPEEIINDLMQEMIGKYSAPRNSGASSDKPGPSKSQTLGHKTDGDYRLRDGSSDSRKTSSRKDTSHGKYADRRPSGSSSTSKDQASNSSTEYNEYPWSKGVPGSEWRDFRQQGRADRDYRLQPGGRGKHQAQRGNRVGRANENNSQFFWKNRKKAQAQGFSAVQRKAKKEITQKHKLWAEKKKAWREERTLKLKEMMDEKDSLAKYGIQLMKWADLTGEHVFIDNPVRSELHTETFSNLLTAFKCTLKKEHLKYCFSTVGQGLSHPGFKRPKIDDDLMELLDAKDDSGAKEKFLKDINPLNKHMENIQHLIMNATIPLFLVCNAYEVNPMTASDKPAALAAALAQNILLCRRSLVLYGQTFSFISSLRQDMVLKALDLPAEPPPPSHFPNMDDSFLFGRDYMAYLRSWIKKDHPPLPKESVSQVVERQEKAPQSSQEDKNVRVDWKTKDTIEKLARFVVEMGPEMEKFNKDRMSSNPDFWFLTAKDSAAYKLYQEKLEEFRHPSGSSSDSSKPKDPKASICQDSQPKDQKLRDPKGWSPLPKSSSSAVVPQSYCFTPPLPPPPRKRNSSPKSPTVSTAHKAPTVSTPPKASTVSTAPKAPTVPPKMIYQGETPRAVDAKTRDTAEKLAQFVAQMGPEMERLNKAKLASYQEFWFLSLQECPAYKFYERKLTEFRQSKQIQPVHSKYIPLVLSKLLYHVRSTPIPDEKTESQDSEPQISGDQIAEPQGALLLLSELYDSDEEDKSQDRVPKDGKPEVSELSETPPQNLVPQDAEPNMPKLAQHSHSETQNHAPQVHRPPDSDPCHTGNEQSRIQVIVPKCGEHVSHLTDSDSKAPEPRNPVHKGEYQVSGLVAPSHNAPQDCNTQASEVCATKPHGPVTRQPEVTQCSVSESGNVPQNCESQLSELCNVEPLKDEHSVSALAELQGSEHHDPAHLVPVLPALVVLGHEPQESKVCASSPKNCGLQNPVLKASETPSPARTDFTQQGHGPQVPDPQELELTRFYQLIQETERAAEERKGSGVTPQTASSAPALSSSPQKRTRSETPGVAPRKKKCLVQKPEVADFVAFGNEKFCGQPALKKKLPKDVDASFHKMEGKKKQSLGSAAVRTKEPVKIATLSGEQSKEPSKEDKFIAFRLKMLQMCKGVLPK